MDKSLEVLQRVGKALNVPLVTDIHESYQAAEVAEVVDVLHIPAFLCRQTDLLLAAGQTGKAGDGGYKMLNRPEVRDGILAEAA
jgi:2-dehydro-3-deoxyphosphooctonate aldolase (KDO 8-P synthase)